MENYEILAAVALAAVIWGITSLIRIVSYLSSRGTKVNFVFIRLFALRYVNQYRNMTREETGRTGAWFHSYVFSMLGALALAVAAILLK
ncbi:MAG: hypothetical protein JXA64_10350 [Candidatus Fermentibacteraceae bacterium]|nr:hypothetical protein [Candidatus Fermentibacteraceae bacterium]MBN2609502.1 hypothetical protein [Candidatus Fermentibacteraceae bacterium]